MRRIILAGLGVVFLMGSADDPEGRHLSSHVPPSVDAVESHINAHLTASDRIGNANCLICLFNDNGHIWTTCEDASDRTAHAGSEPFGFGIRKDNGAEVFSLYSEIDLVLNEFVDWRFESIFPCYSGLSGRGNKSLKSDLDVLSRRFPYVLVSPSNSSVFGEIPVFFRIVWENALGIQNDPWALFKSRNNVGVSGDGKSLKSRAVGVRGVFESLFGLTKVLDDKVDSNSASQKGEGSDYEGPEIPKRRGLLCFEIILSLLVSMVGLICLGETYKPIDVAMFRHDGHTGAEAFGSVLLIVFGLVGALGGIAIMLG